MGSGGNSVGFSGTFRRCYIGRRLGVSSRGFQGITGDSGKGSECLPGTFGKFQVDPEGF